VTLRPARPADLPRLAALQAASFEVPWSAQSLAATLEGEGVLALVGEAEGGICGFIVARTAAGEAEILTLAVDPARRRKGLGEGLAAAAIEAARAAGAEAVFLEVATDNPAAIALYEKLGFVAAGRRRAYYPRREGPRVDALILRRDLTP
jgi:[ribosomal protein S18]-alanine N-acetyltransferase